MNIYINELKEINRTINDIPILEWDPRSRVNYTSGDYCISEGKIYKRLRTSIEDESTKPGLNTSYWDPIPYFVKSIGESRTYYEYGDLIQGSIDGEIKLIKNTCRNRAAFFKYLIL